MSQSDLFTPLIDADAAYALFASKPALTPDNAGVFMGVTSTGIFCRPGCPARLPKAQNCRFYHSAEAALTAGFRACKRCHPTRLPGEASTLIKTLVSLVEDDIEHRWREQDLIARGIDPSTARRQFKSRFGMTFTQYARARRLGAAHNTLVSGEAVITAQVSAGYDSASGFRAAFSKTFGAPPKNKSAPPLMVDWIDTALGPMIAVCDSAHLYLLEFTDRKALPKQFARLSKVHGRAIIPGRTDITAQISDELTQYFDGSLQDFKTPLAPTGTDFQKQTWAALCAIPYGQTRSYAQLAEAVGNPKAVRAVAGSNASNGMALIIPCHRVIRTGGHLGGYAGGLGRKNWLLAHEAKHAKA
ncbi:bifunctional transcriptional activator/DNA repair enzyme AdaA [Fretibacter rubidus]|uniref:bifunctional transcriptional activator/DNA repair enzyme AdaA n=1 Tax=Fretibacter rubidus TaxID=570162 RepID=UPI00352AE941